MRKNRTYVVGLSRMVEESTEIEVWAANEDEAIEKALSQENKVVVWNREFPAFSETTAVVAGVYGDED